MCHLARHSNEPIDHGIALPPTAASAMAAAAASAACAPTGAGSLEEAAATSYHCVPSAASSAVRFFDCDAAGAASSAWKASRSGPWLCRLLLCDNSPECQKSAVQALQLLGWCGGAALDDMRHHLGKELLQALMDAADAPEAVSGIAGAMIDPLRTHIEAFVKEQGLS